jgi:hypothetical protein
MRTSLNEIQTIEKHLQGQLSGGNEALFQANLLLNPVLPQQVRVQVQSYRLIQAYGRKQLSAEIRQVQEQLFTAPEHKTFLQRILTFFSAR